VAITDAYNGANSFPHMIYELLLGGLSSSLFSPLLMRARLRGREYTRELTQRALTSGTVAMALLTLLAVAHPRHRGSDCFGAGCVDGHFRRAG
jgi:putative peptidoglycan lipid II flippase